MITMDENTLQEEKLYLDNTLHLIRQELETLSNDLASARKDLIASRQEMWENTVHHSHDFTKLTEINQYLSEVKTRSENFTLTAKLMTRYTKLLASPYFGRIDFKEDDLQIQEKIYIGIANVLDKKTRDVFVYDWRAPIASIFYRFELGKASYETPVGISTGDLLLKRQYKISDSQLQFFFDCSLRITDEILQQMLSHNSSSQMKNIVETIQKEQDQIIRDAEHDVLLVQGVAGSGKTSVALHRIAYLLYAGLHSPLRSAQAIIISPTDVFSQYISGVLPELGEENVLQITFDEIVSRVLTEQLNLETRSQQLETILKSPVMEDVGLRRQSMAFKGSAVFRQILANLIRYYERRVLSFEDVSYHGILLETGPILKARLLNNKAGIPLAKQLQRIESMLLQKVRPQQKEHLARLEKIVATSEGHQLEVKPYSRLLAIKENAAFLRRLQKFTTVDYRHLYALLFQQQGLLRKLAAGLELPEQIDRIIALTVQTLTRDQYLYEDAAPLAFLALKINGTHQFAEIRQVVIDEAQDYSPLQYELCNLLFRNAKYTILGDIQQSVGFGTEAGYYDDIAAILNRPKTAKLVLATSYRSTCEIQAFAHKLLGTAPTTPSFQRHGEEPRIIGKKNREAVDLAVIHEINDLQKEELESIAIICKTQQAAEMVYQELSRSVSITLITPDEHRIEKGPLVISSYMAKGLEFDAVIVYGADVVNYADDLDRRLLYIACTRALHRLTVTYSEEISRFLKDSLPV